VSTSTVIGSTTFVLLMYAPKTNEKSKGLRPLYWPRYASMLFLTTVASSALPSWNLMPERSLIVHTVLAAFPVTDSARNGLYFSFASGTTKVS